jgi:hypothetical protein
MNTLKKNAPPLCIIYMLMPWIITLVTLTLVRMWYLETTLGKNPTIAMYLRKKSQRFVLKVIPSWGPSWLRNILKLLSILKYLQSSQSTTLLPPWHPNYSLPHKPFSLVCMYYSVTLFLWTRIFDWCVVWWGSKEQHQKDTCFKEIGLHL